MLFCCCVCFVLFVVVFWGVVFKHHPASEPVLHTVYVLGFYFSFLILGCCSQLTKAEFSLNIMH